MSKNKQYAGQTSNSLAIFIQDTSSTTGGGLSGVTSASSGLVLEYRRYGQSSWTSVSPVSKTLGTYVSGGIVADGSLAGGYEVDFPDAAFAAGARLVWLRVRGVTNMLPVLIEIELDAVDYQDGAGFGLSRINDTITSRMASYTQPTGFLGATFPTTVASTTNITQATGVTLTAGTGLGNQTANITGDLSGSVGSVTNPVTVGTNNDKTNYTISSVGIAAFWSTLTSGLTTVNSIGKLLVDTLDATISSRSTYAGTDTPGTTTLLGRLTGTRATNLDFLDAAISSVLSSISGLNNLSAKCNLFGAALLEAPESGSTVYEFYLVVKDDEDKLVNLDTSPTVTATNASGTDRSANLSAVTNPSTGKYRFTYTVSSSHSRESLRIEANGTVSAETRYGIWTGAVVDYDTTSILQSVQTTVNAIDTRLPTLPAAVGDIPTASANATAVWSNATRTLSAFAFQVTVGGYAAGQAPLQPTVSGRTLDVTSTGAAGIDWGNIENQNANIYLTNTRINQVNDVLGSVGEIAGITFPTHFDNLSITPNGHVTAAVDSISNNAITDSALADSAVTEIVTGVWSRDLSTFGANTAGKNLYDTIAGVTTLLTRIPAATAQLVTDLALMLVGSGTALVRWTAQALSLGPTGEQQTITATVAVPQLLEQTAFELQAIVVYRGCFWSFQIEDLGDLNGYSEIWFSLRKRQDDKEENSTLLISKTEGLLIANKSNVVTPTNGSLTVSGQNVTIQVHQLVTQFVDPSNNYNYDLKGRNVAGQTIMLHESDKFTVKRDVTRRIS